MCEEDWMGRLDLLKDLKFRHEALGDVEKRLRKTHLQLKTEEKNRTDYKSEINALEGEKLELIDRLRKVNKDLEEMNTVEKGSQEYVQKLMKNKDKLVEDYLPLKDGVDRLRSSLDIEKAPDLSEEGIDIPTFFSVRIENQQPHFPNLMVSPGSHSIDYGAFHPCMPYNPMHGQHAGPPPNSLLANAMNNNSINIGDSGLTIKQRAPPMKKCPTCSHEIHRNAPICPICKSKSHSKNPKKSKKKLNENKTS